MKIYYNTIPSAATNCARLKCLADAQVDARGRFVRTTVQFKSPIETEQKRRGMNPDSKADTFSNIEYIKIRRPAIDISKVGKKYQAE